MKKTIKTLALLMVTSVIFTNCDKNDDTSVSTPNYVPTSAAFKNLRNIALANELQEFNFNAGTGNFSFTSENGVTVTINSNCLTKNGVALTSGNVEVDYVELFDKGTMLVTNKPTMGVMPNGNKELLISGGEFFIEAQHNGIKLETTCNISLVIPTALTGGQEAGMLLWTGDNTNEEDLAWKRDNPTAGQNGIDANNNNYYASFGNFGWTNVDKFYSDPRPKTTILIDVPANYDNTNSAVYLSYDGEGQNALAKMDTYTAGGLFSEHYGQIPVGLACHIIFVTEENGQWRYAVKGITTTANATYSILQAETVLGTEAQLVAAINAIQ